MCIIHKKIDLIMRVWTGMLGGMKIVKRKD